jgi:hypothetical protein
MVMRELKCTKAEARHRVRTKIVDYFQHTGDSIWHPIGNHGYANLRRAILAGLVQDNELR